MHQGEGFRLERLPLGAKVIYPPDSLPGIRNVDAAIRHALLNPHGTEPLPELLTPGMRLTIVFDDLSLPLPPMQTPDVRQRIIEQVLDAIRLAESAPLDGYVGTTYPLARWREALTHAADAGRLGTVKVAFDPAR